MDTIQNYEEEGSALGRLEMWGVAIDIAARRAIWGGGFRIHYTDWAYANQPPDFHRRSFHSIYFEVLAYHGYVGLFLFLMMGLSAYLVARNMKVKTRNREDLRDQYELATWAQCSIVAYHVSGAFQNLAHYDLYYGILAIMVIAKTQVDAKLAQTTDQKTESFTERAAEIREAAIPGSFVRGSQPVKSFLR